MNFSKDLISSSTHVVFEDGVRAVVKDGANTLLNIELSDIDYPGTPEYTFKLPTLVFLKIYARFIRKIEDSEGNEVVFTSSAPNKFFQILEECSDTVDFFKNDPIQLNEFLCFSTKHSSLGELSLLVPLSRYDFETKQIKGYRMGVGINSLRLSSVSIENDRFVFENDDNFAQIASSTWVFMPQDSEKLASNPVCTGVAENKSIRRAFFTGGIQITIPKEKSRLIEDTALLIDSPDGEVIEIFVGSPCRDVIEKCLKYTHAIDIQKDGRRLFI